ncbi:MAG TPA: hypothetical protein VJK07_00265 [Candidatus Nanoarchaeia archaeon]|nr:hypothetical protein [Candidatus Nanoarchaeia archaeon]
MNLQKFIAELSGARVEGELIKTFFISLISSLAVLVLAWVVRLRFIEGFWSDYGLLTGYAVLTYALLVPAMRQIRAYGQFACMTGMMIGMTLGMMAGFLTGFYLGATNGMFVGAVFGMIVGISVGTWTGGCCCGIMGYMEGIMAGFMGGIMGAMTSVMMLNDHLRAAALIVTGISAFIIISLNVLVHQEMEKESRQNHEGQSRTIILSAALTAATIWIMVFGPRSGLFG